MNMNVQFKGFPMWVKLEVQKIEHGFVWLRWCNDATHETHNGDLTTAEWGEFHKATMHALEDLGERTVIVNAKMIEYMR